MFAKIDLDKDVSLAGAESIVGLPKTRSRANAQQRPKECCDAACLPMRRRPPV
jgi:hypothetical protein